MRYVLPLMLLPIPALADPPTIEGVETRRQATGWDFNVTIRHPDTGWDHYADGWRIELEDGTELGFRELFHPHVDEQPFTRGTSGIDIPDGTRTVYIRARCSVDGWSETRVAVTLP